MKIGNEMTQNFENCLLNYIFNVEDLKASSFFKICILTKYPQIF